ncbi:MAG: 3D domain-containing protein [Bacillota bacterium]
MRKIVFIGIMVSLLAILTFTHFHTVLKPALAGMILPAGARPITRGEFVVRLLSARGIVPDEARGLFVDVPAGSPNAAYIETAAGLNVVNGRGGGRFAPDDPLTRQEMVKMAVAASKNGKNVKQHEVIVASLLHPFNDGTQVDTWARPYTAQAILDGILTVSSDWTLRPRDTATVDEVEAVVARIAAGSAPEMVIVTHGGQMTLMVNGIALPVEREINVIATAYDDTVYSNGIWGPIDCFGAPLREGTIAVDPRVIPLNSLLCITGYRSPHLPPGGMLGVARDTGSAIKGNRIDIFIDAPRPEVLAFGVQAVKVYILRKPE